MPSSPTFSDYARSTERFFYRGIQLKPQDALSEGKLSWALNIRSYEEGTITVRDGISVLTDAALGNPIFSAFRLEDTTPYATPSTDNVRILGAGTSIYGGQVNGTTPESYGVIGATTFSGDPLTGVISTPFASPRPYLYIGDSVGSRKINSDFDDYPIGIATPVNEPEADYAAVQITYLNSVESGLWSSYGNATPASPTALPITQYINTTINEILYDNGAAPSMAAIALADMTNVVPGISIVIGASNEEVIVEEVHPALAPTTIARILYDVGTNGLCTIQPAGSFTQGQIEQAVPADVQQRYDAQGIQPPRVTVSRTVDFAVDSLIQLDALETVRILSVAIGQDGTMSFRCTTSNTFAIGDAITGVPSFRAYVNTAVVAADAATASCVSNTITNATVDTAEVGGMQSPIGGGSRNWGLVGNRASQPGDFIRFAIRLSSYAFVQSVRLLLNVSDDTGSGGSDFLHNYYMYEWRQNDLLAAIQIAAGQATALFSTEQATAVQQGQVDAYYQDQYGYNTTIQSGSAGFGRMGYLLSDEGKRQLMDRIAKSRAENDAAARAQKADGGVTVGSSISRQLAVGNDQWVVLQCRLGDLTRIGTEQTLTLNAIIGAAVTVQVSGTTDPITVDYADAYLLGGYGPDVSNTWNPYVYRYRYRSTLTGARSNPSPPMRAGVKPHRGRVLVAGEQSSDPQCDVIDWYRLGGALARWSYVGTSDNESSPLYTDDLADGQIEAGETLDFSKFQPWPVQDLPRSGLCTIAGTAVERTSGDDFNTAWSAGSLVLINGRATVLYKQPQSTDRFYVVDNIGEGTGIEFSLPSPTIVSQPLPALWGGPINDVLYHFACGDPSDPGVLHWSQGNDPDASSDVNTLTITSGADPLQNGCFYDGIPYVFSSNDLYRIGATFGDATAFRTSKTACGKGLWSRWFFCVTPYGIVFGSNDGIYITTGGSPAQSLTDDDLRPLFPQDGSISDPSAIRNLSPVDFTQVQYLRLTYVDRLVYFDYMDVEGELRTLVYDFRVQGWTPDVYPLSGATCRLNEGGPDVHSALMGAADGHLYVNDAGKTTDADTDVPWAVWTRWPNAGDPRAWKQWGDAILDMNPGGSFSGVQVTPVINNGNTALEPNLLGSLDGERATYIVEVGEDEDALGDGVWSRNLGLLIEGTVQLCDTNRPILYLWEPSFVAKQVSVGFRATDWQDLGYNGAKFVQGVVIRANTFGSPKTVNVQYDGPNGSPQTALALTINHNGEQTKAYPLAAAGWEPFIAELVRLQGADDVEWALLDWRFVFEPAPELATQWETQYTTHDLPGFLAVYDGVIAYMATAEVTWEIEYQDGFVDSYTLPSTAGAYSRTRVITAARKGKAVRYTWTSDEPFRLIKPDCSVRVQGWGVPGGYQILSPFGGPSRADGAGI